APDQFALRSLGLVAVDGSAEEMEVFECMACYPEKLKDRIMANHDLYSDALATYRAGQWAQAQKRFELCVDACEQDMVAQSFAHRCADRGLGGKGWDGFERPAKG